MAEDALWFQVGINLRESDGPCSEGQAGHDIPFWLYNLPFNLFMLNERQMLAIAFLDQNSGPKRFLQLSSGAWT